jgi:hypothetical protein
MGGCHGEGSLYSHMSAGEHCSHHGGSGCFFGNGVGASRTGSRCSRRPSRSRRTPAQSYPGRIGARCCFFAAAKVFFRSVFSVTGSLDDAGQGGINVGVTNGGPGLGPQFNLNSCGGCHAQPVTGGTSPSVNPEVAMATIRGAHNKVPPFITLDGPVRERRGTVPQYIHHQAAMSFPELQT